MKILSRRANIKKKIAKAVHKAREELEVFYFNELKDEEERLDYNYNARIKRQENIIKELEKTVKNLRERDAGRKTIRHDMEIARDILIKTNKNLLENFMRFYRENENKITMAENLEDIDNKIKEV